MIYLNDLNYLNGGSKLFKIALKYDVFNCLLTRMNWPVVCFCIIKWLIITCLINFFNEMKKGDKNGKILIWNINNSSLSKTLISHEGAINDFALIQKEMLLASSSFDLTIKLWSLYTFSLVNTLRGHANIVYGLNLVSNNSILASSSYDNTIKLWNFTNGEGHLINTLKGHTSTLYWSLDSIDSDTIISGSHDKTIKFWQITTGKNLKSISTNSLITSLLVFC
jgi:WD40 repeat protein